MTTEAEHDREAAMLARLFERAEVVGRRAALLDAAVAVADWYRDGDTGDYDLVMADLCAAVDDYRRRARR